MADAKQSGTSEADAYLVERIRDGDPDAWQSLIDRYEGRLMAFTDSRIRNRATSEDIVQEAFIGFLISLPNYDGGRPLESYLFSICAYKLTDHLRREGRRPSIQMHHRGSSSGGQIEAVGSDRVASSIAQRRTKGDRGGGGTRRRRGTDRAMEKQRWMDQAQGDRVAIRPRPTEQGRRDRSSILPSNRSPTTRATFKFACDPSCGE